MTYARSAFAFKMELSDAAGVFPPRMPAAPSSPPPTSADGLGGPLPADDTGSGVDAAAVKAPTAPALMPDPELTDTAALARRLQLVQRFGRIGTWERDIATGRGRWDREAFRILGFDPDAGTPPMDTVIATLLPDDQARMREAWLESIAAASRGEVRVRILGQDGRWRMIHSIWEIECGASGEPVRGLGVFLDESDAVAAARELSEMTQRFELASSLGELGVFRVELDSSRVWWDARLCALLELDGSDREMPFEEALRYVHPEDVGRVVAAQDEAVRTGQAVEVEYRLITARGGLRNVLTRRALSRAPGTGRLVMVGLALDVTESWRQRHALERLVHRLQLATTIGGIGIWDWQEAQGQWAVSQVMLDQIAATRDEVGTLGIDAVIAALHPDDRSRFRRGIEALLRGEALDMSGEFRVPVADRRVRHLSMQARAQRGPGGGVFRVTGISLDVTDQKQATLKERFLNDIVADGVWEWDVHRGRTWMSDGYRKRFALPAGGADETDAQYFERVHPSDLARVSAELDALVQGRIEASSIEYRLRDPNGRYLWIIDRSAAIERDVDGRAVRILGAFLDTTRMHEVEQKLHEEQELASLAAASADMGVWTWDVATNSIDFDTRMFGLFGIDRGPGPIAFDEWLDMVHPDDRDSVIGLFQKAFRVDDHYHSEARIRRRDGAERILAGRGRFLPSASGLPRTAIGIAWDVTEQHEAEAAVRAREAAERANQAKSEFLSRVSHELRTPLNAVLGFTELLLSPDRQHSPAEQRQNLERIRSAGRHLRRLIDDMLDLSRIESGTIGFDIRPIELGPVLADAIDMVGLQAEAGGVTLALEPMPADPVYVSADDLRLREVIWNLLSNAVKYNRPGGQVTVAVARSDEGRVRLSVRDTGIGLNASQLGQLFQPFNRLGREHSGVEGFGIGLALSHRFVERMGGRLSARSDEGVGSEFVVELVQATPGATPQDEPADTADAPQPRGPATGTVLYVEDNALNRLLIEQYLAARPGVRLLAAATAIEGLELARSHRPDLMLIDLHLPDMSGIELVERLRASPDTRALPCVALSADVPAGGTEGARRFGFADFLSKPVHPQEFLRRIDTLLSGPPA
jgi:PAS domain S-box-containing protein